MSVAGFPVNITGFVPEVCWYKDGVVFNNEAAGCAAINADTGEVIKTWPGTVDHEAWAPPGGVKNLIMRPNTPGI